MSSSSLCGVVVALLEGCDACAPSMHGPQLALVLAQQLASGTSASRALLLTFGVLGAHDARSSSEASQGGVWGFARVQRLEHQRPVRLTQSEQQGEGSRLRVELGALATRAIREGMGEQR